MMQFQADILGIPVVRPVELETTALGAALLAGIGVGLYASKEEAASMVSPTDLPAPDGRPQPRPGPVRLGTGRWNGHKIGWKYDKVNQNSAAGIPFGSAVFLFSDYIARLAAASADPSASDLSLEKIIRPALV